MEQNLLHNSGLREIVEADGRGSLPGCTAVALSHGNSLCWPPFIQPKEWNPPQLSLAAISLTAGHVATTDLIEPPVLSNSPAAGLVVHGTGVHPMPVPWCCAHADVALNGARHMLQLSVFALRFPEFPCHEEWENLCCKPLDSGEAFWRNEQPWCDDHLHPLTQVTAAKILW